MTQREIRKEQKRLLGELRKAEAQVKTAQNALKALQLQCEHPNEYRTSHQGDTCYHCPDCGNCP